MAVAGRALACLPLVVSAARATAQTCPDPPPVTVSSSAVSADVCVPDGFGGNPIQFFDDFSWRSFVALVWPALDGQRGTPDPAQTVGGKGPRVFETYKTLHEVFHADGSAPTAWNSYDPPHFNACNVQMAFGDLVLASFSKFADLGQAGLGILLGPLVAQNTTYVRYETGFNQSEFNQIVGPKWYLRSNLPASITFQNGSIDIKSAWIDMAKMPHPERYYTRTAWLLDPDTGACAQKSVGLVGLHIVQKTPTRPQWIWTTFEQVDNVPPPQAGAPGTFTFNDGSGTAMPAANPYTLDPLPTPTPPPFNVTRKLPVHASTQKTNAAYRAALAGTVWEFYELTMSQWPSDASDPAKPGTPDNTFPGVGATTAFANTALETFDQEHIQKGCMNCHNSTRVATDFVWSLKDHAFPSNVPNLLITDPGFKELQTMLRTFPQTSAAAAQQKTIELLQEAVKPEGTTPHHE
jgi:hypothetical protein